MEYLTYVGFGVVTLLLFLERIWHRIDMAKLLDRMMAIVDAKSYEMMRYYTKQYPKDVKEIDKIREEERKIRKMEEQDVFQDDSTNVKDKEKAREFLSNMASDWGADEVDIAKIIDLESEDEVRIEDGGQDNLA